MRVHTVEDLGLLIRERRRALGLDQQALAARVGVSRQWIIAVEKGKSRAEVGLVLRTLKALELELSIDSAEERSREPVPGDATDAEVPDIDIDAVIDSAKGRTR
jgi:HTH-type transcriptional regulator / antitoxin HipB